MGEHNRFVSRQALLDTALYALFVALYFFLVWRYLNAPLTRLFESNLLAYGAAGLGLIAVQAAGLDALTAWLARKLIARLWG